MPAAQGYTSASTPIQFLQDSKQLLHLRSNPQVAAALDLLVKEGAINLETMELEKPSEMNMELEGIQAKEEMDESAKELPRTVSAAPAPGLLDESLPKSAAAAAKIGGNEGRWKGGGRKSKGGGKGKQSKRKGKEWKETERNGMEPTRISPLAKVQAKASHAELLL